MKDYLINKRLKELCKNGHLNNDQNFLLLEEYAQDKQNGVLPEDSEARTLLILGNSKLIFHILKVSFKLNADTNSDEFSVGQIGLIKAIDTFRLDTDIKFSTYASTVIQNEVGMYYNKLRRKHLMPEQQIFLEDCINDDVNDDEKIRIMDTITDEENFVEKIQDAEWVKDIITNLRYLTYNEAFAIIMNFGLLGNKPLIHKNIAKLLNISRSYATKILKKAIKKLQVLVIGEQDLDFNDVILKDELLKDGFKNNIIEEMNQNKGGHNI